MIILTFFQKKCSFFTQKCSFCDKIFGHTPPKTAEFADFLCGSNTFLGQNFFRLYSQNNQNFCIEQNFCIRNFKIFVFLVKISQYAKIGSLCSAWMLKLYQKLLNNILYWNPEGFFDTSIVQKMTVTLKLLKRPQNGQF